MTMTLQNLAKIGQLNAHKATSEEVARLLAAVRRNLADAEAKGISNETRFDCGYKAVMQCALVAMMANGYRPSTSAPGHHQTMLQSLPLTLGVSNDVWIVLDALRKKRNQNDYTGLPLASTEVKEAIERAKELLTILLSYLQARHPELLK
jgi:hypothetical protein